MWDKTVDETNTFQFDCDECNGNYQLPPPKFHIPPPPIPPSLKNNFIQCNKDDLINRINNWDNDMCDAIPTFDASFYSSPFLHTLILVAVFSFILILVIILSVIYVRRLIKQKNGGCKDLKNLVKHHLNKTNNSNLEKLPTPATTDNYYEECYNCNEYTISRQAKDFIGYTITTEGHQQQTSATTLANTGISRTPRPSIQNSLFNTEHYFGYNNNINRQNLNQYTIYNDYSGYFNEPINQNNHYNLNQNYNHYFNNQNINLNNQYYNNNRQFEYSRTYDDFIELNNSTSPSTTTTDDCSGIDSTSNNNYPEYIDIELAVPNL